MTEQQYIINNSTLENIAKSIRNKTGKTELIPVTNFANEINNISLGTEEDIDITWESSDTEGKTTAIYNGTTLVKISSSTIDLIGASFSFSLATGAFSGTFTEETKTIIDEQTTAFIIENTPVVFCVSVPNAIFPESGIYLITEEVTSAPFTLTLQKFSNAYLWDMKKISLSINDLNEDDSTLSVPKASDDIITSIKDIMGTYFSIITPESTQMTPISEALIKQENDIIFVGEDPLYYFYNVLKDGASYTPKDSTEPIIFETAGIYWGGLPLFLIGLGGENVVFEYFYKNKKQNVNGEFIPIPLGIVENGKVDLLEALKTGMIVSSVDVRVPGIMPNGTEDQIIVAENQSIIKGDFITMETGNWWRTSQLYGAYDALNNLLGITDKIIVSLDSTENVLKVVSWTVEDNNIYKNNICIINESIEYGDMREPFLLKLSDNKILAGYRQTSGATGQYFSILNIDDNGIMTQINCINVLSCNGIDSIASINETTFALIGDDKKLYVIKINEDNSFSITHNYTISSSALRSSTIVPLSDNKLCIFYVDDKKLYAQIFNINETITVGSQLLLYSSSSSFFENIGACIIKDDYILFVREVYNSNKLIVTILSINEDTISLGTTAELFTERSTSYDFEPIQCISYQDNKILLMGQGDYALLQFDEALTSITVLSTCYHHDEDMGDTMYSNIGIAKTGDSSFISFMYYDNDWDDDLSEVIQYKIIDNNIISPVGVEPMGPFVSKAIGSKTINGIAYTSGIAGEKIKIYTI